MKLGIEIIALIVKPINEPIFSEMATRIYIEDEAAGPFVVVQQQAPGYDKIAIDPEEWPDIKKAIEDLLIICQNMEILNP